MSPNSKEKLKKYIEDKLDHLAVLPDENQSYNNIVLAEFRTHHENGNIFKHKDGDIYGIAIFNVITSKGNEIITDFLKKSDINYEKLHELVENLKLTKYINGNTKKYLYWESGDTGIVHYRFDSSKNKYIITSFANHTAMNKIIPVRERYTKSSETHSNFVYDDEESRSSFNSDFYNDQLDMDQQSPEFWDGQ